MKNIYCLLGLFFICYSCSESDESFIDVSDVSVLPEMKTRTVVDEIYNVLGYGYDVTGEYLHPLSVLNPVLDIKRYEKDYLTRLHVLSSTYGNDMKFYGYSSEDYLKDITKDTKATTTMGYGTEKDVTFFSGSISNSSYFRTEYSYSNKYSFASLDAIRNLKHIYINDEISRISQYLSDDFKEDLDRLSPDRLVERYGTHVLTDFIIGGRYKLLYRSIISSVKDSSSKRIAVNSGFLISLDKIKFNYNLENKETINQNLAKENQNKELYVLFYGGSGTNLKYDLEKEAPTIVDIQSWENSITANNSCLNSINWTETYPIYDFIDDPIKKKEIKDAVDRRIAASKINVLELIPLYLYSNPKQNHYTTTLSDVVENYPGWEYYGTECYILKNQLPGTIPLYEYYHNDGFDHYTTTISNVASNPKDGWVRLRISGYVYADKGIDNMEVIDLYDYFYKYSGRNFDHYTTTDPFISSKFPGWKMQNRSGYVYPAY